MILFPFTQLSRQPFHALPYLQHSCSRSLSEGVFSLKGEKNEK